MNEDIPVNNTMNACEDQKLKAHVLFYCEPNGEVFSLVYILRFFHDCHYSACGLLGCDTVKSCSGYQHLGRTWCLFFRDTVSIVPTTRDGVPFPNSLLWVRVTTFVATCLYNPTHFSPEEGGQHIPSKRL
jgi:hypothetical protein